MDAIRVLLQDDHSMSLNVIVFLASRTKSLDVRFKEAFYSQMPENIRISSNLSTGPKPPHVTWRLGNARGKTQSQPYFRWPWTTGNKGKSIIMRTKSELSLILRNYC
jgi:hypothetical protein